MRVISKWPVVDHPPSAFQEDEVVKVLKEDSAGLTDSARNCLARAREFTEEADDIESCVRIQS